MADSLILVANPGSSSRKYALFDHELKLRGALHFETIDDTVVCHVSKPGKDSESATLGSQDISSSLDHVPQLFLAHGFMDKTETIGAAGLRVVAPGSYFLKNHLIDDETIEKLHAAHSLAPLHIKATLDELEQLRSKYPDTPIVGVSDSAFHITKPPYAWNYGINIQDADRFEIKRYGYHGISAAASVAALWNRGKLPPKVIVCHLGSGSSITAVFHGRSIDTTMGFTPLEGVVMANRSGDIGIGAVSALQRHLGLDDSGIENYLNHNAGLHGLGASDDVRELLKREADGEPLAHLALTTLIHSIHKAIGQMIVTLNGADLIVFTGTIGERSAMIRKRIVAHLQFADFILDGTANDACTDPQKLTVISQSGKSRPIMVIPTNEALEIARHTKKLI